MTRRCDREGVTLPRIGRCFCGEVTQHCECGTGPAPDDVLAWAAWYSGREPARARRGWMHDLVVGHLRTLAPERLP